MEVIEQCILGKILVTDEYEKIINSIKKNQVPPGWNFLYLSQKPLSSWVEDLENRIEQLSEWGLKSFPVYFWLGGLSFPLGFLTAVK